MNIRRAIATFITSALVVLPGAASAQYYDPYAYGMYDYYPTTYMPMVYVNYSMPTYAYYPQQYSYYPYQPTQYYYPQQYSYNQPMQYSAYTPYSSYMPTSYSTPGPWNASYRTGDTDTFGYELCNWDGYQGRARCDSNPRQPVYDAWTGTWY